MRVLLTTFGSYGDLHPYLAIGIELVRRGHEVVLATSAIYEEKVRSEGLDFAAVRPDVSAVDQAFFERLMDQRRGSERVLRFLAESVRDAYEDTLPMARKADVIVTHPITFGPLLVARKLGMPWVSTHLAPATLFSADDPPVMAHAPGLVRLRALGPWAIRALITISRPTVASWIRPVMRLRDELGLQSMGHPLFEGMNSPQRVLALFSCCLAAPQPDWPPQTLVTGFPFFDRHHEQAGMPPEIERSLEAGPAPLVFSLGTSAVQTAGDFYTVSLEVAQALKMRAIFLTGQSPQGLPEDAMTAAYAPHSELFPRAAAIVHHGGIGTTSQAMRSGRPMLVTPFAHDQFDNGERARRLGIAEVLYRKKYTVGAAVPILRRLVEEARYASAGASVASLVRAEDGAGVAADAIIRAAGG